MGLWRLAWPREHELGSVGRAWAGVTAPRGSGRHACSSQGTPTQGVGRGALARPGTCRRPSAPTSTPPHAQAKNIDSLPWAMTGVTIIATVLYTLLALALSMLLPATAISASDGMGHDFLTIGAGEWGGGSGEVQEYAWTDLVTRCMSPVQSPRTLAMLLCTCGTVHRPLGVSHSRRVCPGSFASRLFLAPHSPCTLQPPPPPFPHGQHPLLDQACTT